MNKTILLFGAFVIGIFFTLPEVTNAAFAFTQISQNGDGKGYTAPSDTPEYQQVYFTVDGTSLNTSNLYGTNGDTRGVNTPISSNSAQACTNAANSSGLSSNNETYCVYDKIVTNADPYFTNVDISCLSCIGGSASHPPGDPPPPPYTADLRRVSIYQSPLQETTLSVMLNSIDEYWSDFWTWGGGGGGGPPPKVPFYDTCTNSHSPQQSHGTRYFGFSPALAFTAGIGILDTPLNTTPSCFVYHQAGVMPPATATLSVNPTNIIVGNSSVLSYGCTNATSASINNGIGSVSPTSGSISVSPIADTTYTVTCTGAGAPGTSSATVTVTPLLTASCSVAPTIANTGDVVTWTAVPTGGSGLYSYSWSGTDGLSGASQTITHSYPSAGVNTGTVTVTSGSQTVTQGCSNSVTVSAGPPPPDADLTAGAITPTSAVAGTPVTLSAPATNDRAATAASGAFPILFQFVESGDLQNSAYLASLNPGQSGTGSTLYTFPSAGTYHVRACANNNTSWVNIVPESNYGNNCGDPTEIVVAPAIAGGAVSCSVSNTAPAVGDTVTYTATVAGGASAPFAWDDSIGGVYGSGATASRTFGRSGDYAMQVTATSAARPAFCPLVTVGRSLCAVATTGGLAATPPRVKKGGTSTIHVELERGTGVTCTLAGPGVNRVYPLISSCTGPIPIFEEEVITPPITTQSVYTLTCEGSQIAQTIVNVIPEFVEF